MEEEIKTTRTPRDRTRIDDWCPIKVKAVYTVSITKVYGFDKMADAARFVDDRATVHGAR